MFLFGYDFDLLARLQTIKENSMRMLYRDLTGEIIVLLCISDRSWILRKSTRGRFGSCIRLAQSTAFGSRL